MLPRPGKQIHYPHPRHNQRHAVANYRDDGWRPLSKAATGLESGGRIDFTGNITDQCDVGVHSALSGWLNMSKF